MKSFIKFTKQLIAAFIEAGTLIYLYHKSTKGGGYSRPTIARDKNNEII